jgi:precorrin-6B methylase 2
MKLSVNIKRSINLVLSTLLTTVLIAQDQTQGTGFVPSIGQAGKDVIWVPTPDELVAKMLEIAKVTANDFVIDLGSGDGRTVIAAAKLGARATGIEYNPEMVTVSKINAEKAGVSGKATFINADLFETDLSEASVITMFLLPEINLKLRPKLLDLKPGTRIVSNTFTMGNWEPDYEVTTGEDWDSWTTALLWIIPAKVEGNWKIDGGELSFRQEFQMFKGTLKSGDKTSDINDGRLSGDTLTFSTNEAKYTGILRGKSNMGGTATTKSAKSDWTATRVD